MDLDDSFTYKLLKRRKARKDYLKVKMVDSPSIMKRTALIEEQQILNEDNEEFMESPKCLHVERVTSKYDVKEEDLTEVKENISAKQQEIKGNNIMKEDDSIEEVPSLRVRGLAALRKKHSAQGNRNERKVSQNTQQRDKPPSSVSPSSHKELCSTRNRLARLAAEINGWEDNLTRSAARATSSTKEVCVAAVEEVESPLDSSFEPSKLPLSERRALFEQAATENKVQSEKPAFKRQGSVALRAAMFEKELPNKYIFRTANQKPVYKPPVKPTVEVGSPVKPAVALGLIQSSSALKGSPIRESTALTRSNAKLITGSPTKSSPAFCCDSPNKPTSLLVRNPNKPSTGNSIKSSVSNYNGPAKSYSTFSCDSPAKSSPAFSCDSPAKSSSTFSLDNPAKSSPAFSRGCPAKSKANGRHTTPTKSLIPRLVMSPRPWQLAKTAIIEPERKQSLSSLVDHWEKLSSLSNVANSQPKRVAKDASLTRLTERFQHAEI